MLNKLLVTTALTGLMISSAIAQSSPPSAPSSSSPPAASSSPSSSGDAMKPSDAAKPSDPAMKSSSDPSNLSATKSTSTTGSATATISSQKPDQMLASKIKGADVIGSDDKKIGDVSDILFAKDGKVEAFILSVGGFLGVGAKEVALAPSSVQLTQDKDNWQIKVSMTKDQLAQAPNFERYKERTTTTGSSSSSTSQSNSAPRNAPSGNTNPPAQRP